MSQKQSAQNVFSLQSPGYEWQPGEQDLHSPFHPPHTQIRSGQKGYAHVLMWLDTQTAQTNSPRKRRVVRGTATCSAVDCGKPATITRKCYYQEEQTQLHLGYLWDANYCCAGHHYHHRDYHHPKAANFSTGPLCIPPAISTTLHLHSQPRSWPCGMRNYFVATTFPSASHQVQHQQLLPFTTGHPRWLAGDLIATCNTSAGLSHSQINLLRQTAVLESRNELRFMYWGLKESLLFEYNIL